MEIFVFMLCGYSIEIRRVFIPIEEWDNDPQDSARLELVWYYGQNENQEVDGCRSISAGDVIRMNGLYYRVCFAGFLPIQPRR